jgi:hypothetical protein
MLLFRNTRTAAPTQAAAAGAGTCSPRLTSDHAFTHVAVANGELDLVSGYVEQLTSHPPVSLAEYLAGTRQQARP